MTQWTVVPVKGVAVESAAILAEALNETEIAGWTVSDVIRIKGGLAIVAFCDDAPAASRQTLKLTPRQRMKAAGVPGCR